MDIIKKIAQEVGCRSNQVEAAVKLIDEGNTIPFIARYRKEATGSLNDEQLRLLHERLTYLRNLEDKKAQVIASIDEQGKLTAELKKRSKQLRQWFWSTTCTGLTDLREKLGQPSHRQRDLKDSQTSSLFRCQEVILLKRQKNIYQRKRA